jgi:type IV secretion system protein VirB6
MFAKLEAWFNTFFLGYAARVSADLATGLVPVALALVTIYIAIYGLAVMRGEASEPVGTFAWKMVKVGAILSFALPGLYYSGNVVAWATGLQDGLAVLFVAPRAAAAATAFGALDLANTAANEQLALLWKDAGMFRLDLVLASILFSLGTTIFLVLGAFVGLLGKLILTFALAIGPWQSCASSSSQRRASSIAGCLSCSAPSCCRGSCSSPWDVSVRLGKGALRPSRTAAPSWLACLGLWVRSKPQAPI